MRQVTDLLAKWQSRKILILGKGPSLTPEAFEKARQGRIVIGINQTVAAFPVDLAFFIDIEPFQEVSEQLRSAACTRVALPWHPNKRTWSKRRSKPSHASLLELTHEQADLAAIDQDQRLFYFHAVKAPIGGSANHFPPELVSISALLQMLGRCGILDIVTLGIDGGKGYSRALSASGLKTQLSRGYDKQFSILKRITLSQGISMHKANEETVNVYVGCEPAQRLAARVLEHSILRNTQYPVNVRRLNEHLPPGLQLGGRTPFSLQRFAIPALNQHKGSAVYLDSDMLVFGDIKELVELRHPDTVVSACLTSEGSTRRPQYSVMVIDCEQAKWQIEQISSLASTNYEAAMFELDFEPSKSREISHHWNSLEAYAPGKTKLLHFTDMDLQPWISVANPLAPVWMEALFQAMKDGFISFDEIVQDTRRGWIRPGVLWQVENQQADPTQAPRRVKAADALYAPPHTVARFTGHNNAATRSMIAVAKRVHHWIGRHNA